MKKTIHFLILDLLFIELSHSDCKDHEFSGLTRLIRVFFLSNFFILVSSFNIEYIDN
jgi:hypothetical protein